MNEAMKKETSTLKDKMRTIVLERDKMIIEAQSNKLRTEAETQSRTDLIEKLNREIIALHKEHERKDKLLKEKDGLIMKTEEFQAQIEALKNKHKMDKIASHKQSLKELEKKQTELDRVGEVVNEKKKLEAKLKWANDQLQHSGVPSSHVLL